MITVAVKNNSQCANSYFILVLVSLHTMHKQLFISSPFLGVHISITMCAPAIPICAIMQHENYFTDNALHLSFYL